MIKGIYSSSSGMQPRLLKLDVVANNIANADTTGFKKNDIFVQILKNAGIAKTTEAGEFAGLDVKEFTDFSEGSFRPTSNPLDVAIQGDGFFVLETPEGPRYTRNGNFKLDDSGDVVNSDGHYLVGAGGHITIPNASAIQQSDISINKNGEIYIGKNQIAKIKIVKFQEMQKLLKVGGTLFATDESPRDIKNNDSDTTLRQGYLEESNVQSLSEMIQLVELSRSFEADQRTMRYQDGTLEKALEVGRI